MCVNPQVLDSILYADQLLIAENPQLSAATVVVHFDSHLAVRAVGLDMKRRITCQIYLIDHVASNVTVSKLSHLYSSQPNSGEIQSHTA